MTSRFSSGEGFFPCADDGTDDYEIDERVAGIDGEDFDGTDLEDVLLGPAGGDKT
jgi:hypothetical protein